MFIALLVLVFGDCVYPCVHMMPLTCNISQDWLVPLVHTTRMVRIAIVRVMIFPIALDMATVVLKGHVCAQRVMRAWSAMHVHQTVMAFHVKSPVPGSQRVTHMGGVLQSKMGLRCPPANVMAGLSIMTVTHVRHARSH